MKNIILVGFMGTGKTTVAALISEQLQLPLMDMDSIIELEQEISIQEIFNKYGEQYFRDLERKLVKKLTLNKGQIISAGGGVILNQKNIDDFKKDGLIVCLNASIKTIMERIGNDKKRPLLEEKNITDISNLLESRLPFYNKINYQINTDNILPEDIANIIIKYYKKLS